MRIVDCPLTDYPFPLNILASFSQLCHFNLFPTDLLAEKYTEARARSIRKYLDKTVAIQIRVTEEKRDQYKRSAQEKGLSLTQYIIKLLEENK